MRISPIEAPAGKHTRHRLNRGGDRHANNALWRIAIIHTSSDMR
ncbi:transposase [Rhodococcus sp. OAS809]